MSARTPCHAAPHCPSDVLALLPLLRDERRVQRNIANCICAACTDGASCSRRELHGTSRERAMELRPPQAKRRCRERLQLMRLQPGEWQRSRFRRRKTDATTANECYDRSWRPRPQAAALHQAGGASAAPLELTALEVHFYAATDYKSGCKSLRFTAGSQHGHGYFVVLRKSAMRCPACARWSEEPRHELAHCCLTHEHLRICWQRTV